MAQRCDGSGFLFEPAKAIGISGKRLMQNFQRHVAQQAGIGAR